MARTTYVFRDGKWIPKEDVRSLPENKSPYFIPDEMEPLVHPCTQEVITSKHKFSRTTREAGCVEVGNEKGYARKHEPSEKEIVRDIYRTLEELNSRR